MNVEKEADYYIFAKAYEDDTHISFVRAVRSMTELKQLKFGCLENFEQIGELFTKDQITNMIHSELVVVTAFWDPVGMVWSEGNIIEIYAKKFIRSNKDDSEMDNLAEICDFEFFND